MAELNCSACEDIRQTSPEFVVNGLTEDICTSIANDTGLNSTDDHNDCTDLHNLNDCLVGNMATEVEAYDVCEWKEFMKNFIPNLWTTLKAIICSICGMWVQIHCTWNSLVNLTTTLAATTGGIAFVRRYRDLGAAGDAVPYWKNITAGFTGSLEIYMDSDGADQGSAVADRDYVVMISNCTNFLGFNDLRAVLTFYSSGDTRAIGDIRASMGQHPSINLRGDTTLSNFSWTTSGAVLLKKGEHIKVDFHVTAADSGTSTVSDAPQVRLHQFVLTWIPINVEKPLDPDEILVC